MTNHSMPANISYSFSDSRLVWDMFSMSFDGCYANLKVQCRSTNTLEQHVFKEVSTQYRNLSESLLGNIGHLPQDSGSMNPEAGYIGKAYLRAMTSSDKNAANLVMSVNRQALKRIKGLVALLSDRLFANRISEYVAWIQMTLDRVSKRRQQAGMQTYS